MLFWYLFHKFKTLSLTLCIRETPKRVENPDEMQHNAEFRQGLHCL